LLGAAVLLFAAGCGKSGGDGDAAPRTVVVYTALDRQFSEPILKDFTKQTGIEVEAVYDTEANKTIGLVNRIRTEANRPRCDVFWNNEIINTMRLKSEGLLQPCEPENAKGYPANFRDADGYWFGFAGRARVLIVNTDLVPAEQTPDSILALADPQWRGKFGIAKPLFGTTASHVACLYAKLGAAEAESLLSAIRANEPAILGGNKPCAEMVGVGKLAFALTDTDDAVTEVDAGRPVKIVFPDCGDGQMGTLLLPNTLAVVKGAPHAAEAQALINYLLSPEVEGRLAEGHSAQIPVNPNTKGKSRVVQGAEICPMQVDFSEAAKKFAEAAKFVEAHFLD